MAHRHGYQGWIQAGVEGLPSLGCAVLRLHVAAQPTLLFEADTAFHTLVRLLLRVFGHVILVLSELGETLA